MLQSPTTTSQGFISRICLRQPHNQSSVLHQKRKWNREDEAPGTTPQHYHLIQLLLHCYSQTWGPCEWVCTLWGSAHPHWTPVTAVQWNRALRAFHPPCVGTDWLLSATFSKQIWSPWTITHPWPVITQAHLSWQQQLHCTWVIDQHGPSLWKWSSNLASWDVWRVRLAGGKVIFHSASLGRLLDGWRLLSQLLYYPGVYKSFSKPRTLQWALNANSEMLQKQQS